MPVAISLVEGLNFSPGLGNSQLKVLYRPADLNSFHLFFTLLGERETEREKEREKEREGERENTHIYTHTCVRLDN